MNDRLFSDDQINISVLRQRAFNLRWATLPEDVIPLTAADPDFPIAQEIQEAVCDYIRQGNLPYVPQEGLPEFRRAVANFISKERSVPSSPEQVLAIDSTAAGMFLITKLLLKPEDEALIFDPVDFLFRQSIEAAGARVVTIPLNPETGRFDPDEIRKRVTSKTKMIGVCHPHNPTGHVLTSGELQFIGELALEHKLWILNDEIWSDIVYTPGSYISPPSLNDEIARRTITVGGFSKNFALAGLRIGFLLSPNLEIHQKLIKILGTQSSPPGVNSLSQIAALTALEKCKYWLEAFLKHLLSLRDEGVKRLNQINGVECHTPEGTYLLFPNIQKFGMNSEKMADYLLKEAKVAVVPGAPQSFGERAEGHIRICFSTSRQIFMEGIERIERALSKLQIKYF